MHDTATEMMQATRARSELKRFGAQCLYSFVFSAVTAFVLCALTPAKATETVGNLPSTQPLVQ